MITEIRGNILVDSEMMFSFPNNGNIVDLSQGGGEKAALAS